MPLSGTSMRPSIASKVDLPAPFGPTSAVIAPEGALAETRSRMRLPPVL